MRNHRRLLDRLQASDHPLSERSAAHGLLYQDRDLRYRWIPEPLGPFTPTIVGKTDFDVLPDTDARRLTSVKRRVMAKQAGETLELRLDDGGIERRFELVIQPWLGEDGRLLGVVVYERDITEPEILQEALLNQFLEVARMFDSVDMVVYVADLETYELLYLNECGERLFGSDAVGQPCYRVLQSGQQGPCAFCTNAMLVQGGVAQQPYVWEFQNTINGRWFMCVDQAIPWSDGRLVRMEAAVDITERKRAERFREQYIGVISHDLRTPLNFLSIACQHLGRQMDERGMPEESETFRRMLKNISRMDAMISDLAESARLEVGEIRLNRRLLDLGAVVREVADELEDPGYPSRVRVDAPPTTDRVLADRNRIERVLQNLIGNALKYSRPDSPVEVRMRPVDGYVEVSVVDHGVGIDPNDQPHVFERFYRTQRTGGAPGIGLGLYIARLLVEAHGGEIGVDSELGVQTQFRFTLPLEIRADR